MHHLSRFLNPKSIAVFGGGWAVNVIEQLLKSNFQGEIWPVHPHREQIVGIPAYRCVDELPGSPDAAFIGVNRNATPDIVAQLSHRQAGGAICFASGFKESQLNRSDPNQDLQTQLVEAAGEMPILGPNCYGFINYLDNVCLWPDQHGGKTVEEGVAIIAQSSNIAINMTMQKRGLALTHMLTIGNQAQIGVSELASAVLSDSRVKAIGFYLEGFGDLREFERMANQARALGKPLVVLKVGKSEKAQQASLTHTASLAGAAAASSAFLERLGIIEVDSIAILLESLKLLHHIGPLSEPTIASMSCSGGEASLMSDMALETALEFPDLSAEQETELGTILGDKVDLANPLDYHTYVWGNVPDMTATFASVLKGRCALNVLVLDLPRSDTCDPSGHDCAIDSIIAAKKSTGSNVAVLSVLPENIEESVSQRLINSGVVPLHGMGDAIAAIDAIIRGGNVLANSDEYKPVTLLKTRSALGCHMGDDQAYSYCLDEAAAKMALQKYGVICPRSQISKAKDAIIDAAKNLNYPMVLKGLGIAHKTEANAVIVNIQSHDELLKAVATISNCPNGYLIEEMVDGVVAELLVGVTVDSTGLALLTIGSGGILTELLSDTVSLCLPASQEQIQTAIKQLNIAKLLSGYRGKPAANFESVVNAIVAISEYAIDQGDSFIELDVNPLMVCDDKSVVVDALIRLSH